MTPSNILLLMEFCDRHYELFQQFIEEEYEIESSEAEVILKEVSKIEAKNE